MTTFTKKYETDPDEIEGFVVRDERCCEIEDNLHDEHHPIYYFIAKVISR